MQREVFACQRLKTAAQAGIKPLAAPSSGRTSPEASQACLCVREERLHDSLQLRVHNQFMVGSHVAACRRQRRADAVSGFGCTIQAKRMAQLAGLAAKRTPCQTLQRIQAAQLAARVWSRGLLGSDVLDVIARRTVLRSGGTSIRHWLTGRGGPVGGSLPTWSPCRQLIGKDLFPVRCRRDWGLCRRERPCGAGWGRARGP